MRHKPELGPGHRMDFATSLDWEGHPEPTFGDSAIFDP